MSGSSTQSYVVKRVAQACLTALALFWGSPAHSAIVLTGQLFFGEIETRFATLANDPVGEGVSDPLSPEGGLQSTLKITGFSGAIAGIGTYTFGDGTALPVHISPDGVATYAGTTPVILEGSRNGTLLVGSVPMQFARLELGREGLHAFDASVRLPAGAGFSTTASSRRHQSRIPLGKVPLGSALLPKNEVVVLRAQDLGLASIWLSVESFPLCLRTTEISWWPGAHRFTMPGGTWEFARQSAHDALDGLQQRARLGDDLHGDVSRLSNDLLFRNPGSSGEVILKSDESGVARLDASMAIGPVTYLTHFPGASLNVVGGQILVKDGRIQSEASQVQVASGVLQFYSPNCPTGDCADTTHSPEWIEFAPDGTQMSVTTDSGLVSSEPIAPFSLHWGYTGSGNYAQRAGPFEHAELLIAGIRLPGDSATLPADQRAAELLFTGFTKTGSIADGERPGTTGYAVGAANYAGLNLRSSPATTGESRFAGTPTGEYPLHVRSKYYARFQGISGVHQASIFRSTLPLYGFATTFESLSLAFLDNAVVDSRTSVHLRVPGPADNPAGPSGFTLALDRLEFGCHGEPGPALLRPENALKHLSYWSSDFQPLSAGFEAATSSVPCAEANAGFLAVGVEMKLPLFARPVTGVLAFRPDGDLATAADGSRFDSRLRLPAQAKLAGPGQSVYRLGGLRHAYFNRWRDPARPSQGFVNVFGVLDVPFFADIPVHLHLIPGFDDLGISMMGGWHADPGVVAGAGEAWTEGGQTPFTRKTFDASNRGYPPGIGLEVYRDVSTAGFNPRAEADWGDVLHFDEFLQWRAAERGFRDDGTLPARSERTLILDLPRRVQTLNAAGGDIHFGVEPALPRLSPNQLLQDISDARSGLYAELTNTMNSVSGQIRDRSGIARAADRLDRLISVHPDAFLRPTLNSTLRPLAHGLFSLLQPAYENAVQAAAAAGKDSAGQAEAGRRQVCALFDTGGAGFSGLFQNFTQGTEMVRGFADALDKSLSDIEDGLQQLLEILQARDVPGAIPPRRERRVILELARRLATPERLGTYGSIVGTEYAGNLADTMQRDYLPQAEQEFAEVERQISQAQAQIQALHRQFKDVSGPAVSSLDAVLSETTELTAWFSGLSNAVCNTLIPAAAAPGRYFSDRTPAQVEDALIAAMEDEFLRRALSERSSLLIRLAVSPSRGIFRGALDQLFAEINEMMRKELDKELSARGLPLTEADVSRLLDILGNVANGSRVRGHARLNIDSLEELRLDGHFSFGLYGLGASVPQERIEFDAWAEAHQYRSDSPADGCRPAGTASTTVSMGSAFTPGDGFAQGMKVGLKAAASFKEGTLLGLGGDILLAGAKQIAGASLTDPSLGFHFGVEGNYIGGAASVSVKDFAGGGTLFVGEACNLSQLTFADPDLLRVLNHHGVDPTRRIAGFWARADGTFPLERLLPVPPLGCLLHLEGRGGVGYYLLVVNNAPFTATAGVLVREGLAGKLYCVLSGTGEVTLLGGATLTDVLNGSGPYVLGHGYVEGSVLGAKRREDFEFNAKLIRRGSSFDAEFHVPFLE